MLRIGTYRGIVLLLLLGGCSDGIPNNPYRSGDIGGNTIFRSFSERPKHLDPAICYSADGSLFTCHIYEPPLQYHFLRRPYALEPLTAEGLPVPKYYDAKGNPLPADVDPDRVAKAVYEITIRKGIMYQPHPCFAKDADGRFLYRDKNPADPADVNDIADFDRTGTRELIAEDYVRQVKRLAHPLLNSPVMSTMEKYILGIGEYAKRLADDVKRERARRKQEQGAGYNRMLDEKERPIVVDLDRHPLPGVELVDRYTYRIILSTKYPQFAYWLAMPFFAPVPHEADDFYAQAAMIDRNITLDRYPVGTGPYRVERINPVREIVLVRNENYHDDRYPADGSAGDREAGLLDDAGKRLPFVDRLVFKREKESIPYWNKFLQGYYDLSGIASDSFDQAVQVSVGGSADLTESMKERGIRLTTQQALSVSYFGFNMADSVVGGLAPEKRKLRQAIAIAVNTEEYIQIFLNNRGIPLHSPLPPGIFGAETGKDYIDPHIYDWDEKAGKPARKSLEEAKRLVAEAGYPGGVDKNGAPLVLHYDATGSDAVSNTYYNWLINKFKAIGITLRVRSTDYSRFQEKMKSGDFQMFAWGWNADYPDAENFYFLLYGPNGKVKYQGENAANYESPEFDTLFRKMERLDDSSERLAIIRQMNGILQRDLPWARLYCPIGYTLYHRWYRNTSENLMVSNGLKYKRIDADDRLSYVRERNSPVLWPLLAVAGLIVLGSLPAIVAVRRKRLGKGGS